MKKIILGILSVFTISTSTSFVSSCNYQVQDFDKLISQKKSFILYLYASASDDSKYGEQGFYKKFYSILKADNGKDHVFQKGDIKTCWNSAPMMNNAQSQTLKQFDSNSKNSPVSFLSFETTSKDFKSIAYPKHVVDFAGKSAYSYYYGASLQKLKDYLTPFESKWFKDGILVFVRNGVYQGIEDITPLIGKVSAGQPINVKYALFFRWSNYYFAANLHKQTNDNVWTPNPVPPKPKPKPKG